MSDWTYEPLILKLKAALAEVESATEQNPPVARTTPRAPAVTTPPRDRGADLQRS